MPQQASPEAAQENLASHPQSIDATRVLRLKRAALTASELQQAILTRDADKTLELCVEIASPELDVLEREACSEELSLRRIMHEVVDDALRQFLFADNTTSDHWKRIFLPDKYGLFEFPQLMSNARWLRQSGSLIPDQTEEQLDPQSLGQLGFKAQALALARFCFCNDGRAHIEYESIAAALDSRLLPSFNNWLLTVHNLFPLRVGEEESTRNQAEAMLSFLKRAQLPHAPLPATNAQSASAFQTPYFTEGSTRALCEAVTGRQMRGLFARFTPDPEVRGTSRPELNALQDSDSIVICPNWYNQHVIHRCMSPLTEGMQRAGATAVRVYRGMLKGHTVPALGWEQQTIDVFHSEDYVLADIALVCRDLREKKIDFAFYPEIVPNNTSMWTSTERIARVQATGYGFPVTSGSKVMDYFVGGLDVEPKETTGSDHTERLILLPGLGVSTTPPPLPDVKRTRPLDDDQIHICATTSKHKLGTNLLLAWDAIQDGETRTTLSLFTNMTVHEANIRAGAIGKLLVHGDVNLNCNVARVDLMNVVADADLCLDSYPYGGFNSLVEVLVCGVPIVTIEGNQARNRFGAAILRRLGLPKFLIAKNYEEYVSAAKRLIQDAGLRQSIRDQLGSPENVLARLADPDMPDHFDAAVKWMREQGPRGKRRQGPVLISAGEKPRLLHS